MKEIVIDVRVKVQYMENINTEENVKLALLSTLKNAGWDVESCIISRLLTDEN